MPKSKVKVKTPDEIKIMAEGGRKLGKVKKQLMEAIGEGVNAWEIEELAGRLIRKTGGKASFKMVPGYSWVTCININEGVVHGVPKKEVVFKAGDVVSTDLGLFYKGFHTDTSFTVAIRADAETRDFLYAGRLALKYAIEKAVAGNRIFDISKAIQETIESRGFSSIRALVGHGIGRNLHEAPQIPCFISGSRKESPRLVESVVLAIEVMYTKGKPDLLVGEDGWTISVSDGKISALFEETVVVTKNGPKVLTGLSLNKAN